MESEGERVDPSPRLQYLLHIEAMQDAGAVFLYNDLAPDEWDGLMILKAERGRKEIKAIKRRL